MWVVKKQYLLAFNIASKTRSAVFLSQNFGRSGVLFNSSVFLYSFLILEILFPTNTDAHPFLRNVIGRSVFHLNVKQGDPNTVHSSCKPPLSVNIILAFMFSFNIS